MTTRSKASNVVEPAVRKEKDSSSDTKSRLIEISDVLGVKQLASLLRISVVDAIKQLMKIGVMANINQTIDFETAARVMAEFGYEARLKSRTGRKSPTLLREIKNQQLQQDRESANLKPRPPVVTVMGHVDHGKTRLLDAIRQTNVMDSEAGGITQHIGAYQVEIDGQKITFLDTPGHEAFTAMRARGAQVTDIAILVVAADDGVMPQTLEAIDHARAAGVPIVVAINKIDKPEANPELVKKQLTDAGLSLEEWGGDTICLQISAKEKKGIQELLENLLLVAEMEELKADFARPAVGVVLEAKLDKTKGVLTTVLVHNGTLKVGDIVVVGTTWGKIKAMFNDARKQVRRAQPATPVEILGPNNLSQAGDTFSVVASEHQAKVLTEKRQLELEKEPSPRPGAVKLSNLFNQVSSGEIKELNIILKTDVQGSIEPIKSSLERLSTDKVKVRVIHSSSGSITENDIMLAIASKGIVIGFNITSESGAQRLAQLEDVSIRYYNVIYNLVDDVSKALEGMLEPTHVEVIDGRAEIRAIFPRGRKDKIAGVYVTEGKISRGASVRVQRQNEVISESTVISLRRFKDDVKEVSSGYECGVGIKDFSEFQIGDILELFRTEEVS